MGQVPRREAREIVGGTTLRILVVDDYEFARDAIRVVLVRVGHEVVIAADGSEAWSRFTAEAFDAVVTDGRMPGVDGVTLAGRVRAASRSIPIVIQTSDPTGASLACRDLETIQVVAFEDFLAKPTRFAHPPGQE